MGRIIPLLLAIALTSCTGCSFFKNITQNPSDLPSRVVVDVTPETGNTVFAAPADNIVIAEVHERDADTFLNYKLDKVDILDGTTLLASQSLDSEYRGRVLFNHVKFQGPEGRVGQLYARIISSADSSYVVKSDPQPFTVITQPSNIFIVEQLDPNIGIKIANPPSNAVLVSVQYNWSDYGWYMISDLIILPKPVAPTNLVLTWYDSNSHFITVTQDTVQ